jgi:hypothetical protein
VPVTAAIEAGGGQFLVILAIPQGSDELRDEDAVDFLRS